MTTEHRHPEAAELGRVAVLMGGSSAERSISLASGAECLAALQSRGVRAEAYDPASNGLNGLGDYDRAFIALHGPGGEDGVIQGALDALGVPYTGAGVLGSALGMDKLRSKQIWRAMGLATPDFRVPQTAEALPEVAEALGLPLFVKPLREGSSLGTTRVRALDELEPAWRAARAFGDDVLIERCIEGNEYTVGILDGEALPTIRIDVMTDFYDFEAKYRSESTRMAIPSGLPAVAEERLAALALEAFAAIDASGWGRVDVMTDAAGEHWLLEVNTVPGMTDHSLVPAAAKARGIEFDELVWRILLTSWRHGETR